VLLNKFNCAQKKVKLAFLKLKKKEIIKKASNDILNTITGLYSLIIGKI